MTTGKHARILTRIWHDEDFTALNSGAQRIYMLTLSQDTLNACGVTTFTERRWSRLARNTTPNAVRKDITELAGACFVIVDEDTEELWVRSYLKYDGILDSPNMIISMANAFDAVHSGRIRKAIIDWFHEHYPDGFRQYLKERFPEGFKKGFPEGFLEVLGEGLPEGSSTHALGAGRARTPSPVPVPALATSPSPVPAAIPSNLNVETGCSAPEGNFKDHPQAGALSKRLASACVGDSRPTINMEAILVVGWALKFVDARIVDEAIGWAETKDPKPVLPRAITPTIIAKAADHGIRMTEFKPKVLA